MDATQAARLMLVKLGIGGWTPARMDKRITAETNQRYETGDAVKCRKSLLISPELEAVRTSAQAIRDTHDKWTVPWADDGTRCLPVSAHHDYQRDMHAAKIVWTERVRDFMSAYPSAIEDAKKRLNGTFNADDYPAPAKLEARFYCEVEVSNVPEGRDFRCDIADEQARQIAADIDTRTRARLADGMTAAWKRLYDALGKLAATTAFHFSSLEALQTVCQTLTVLNFANDPNLEAMRQQVEAQFSALEKADLNASSRERVTASATEIMDAMKAFM